MNENEQPVNGEGKEVKEKSRFANAVFNVGKGTAKLAENVKKSVVQVMDANNDGKFDFKDIVDIANRGKEKREKDRLEKEINTLKPIFKETITSPEFVLPKLIRIADIDKKHADGISCQNSVGFRTEYDGVQVVTIYPKHVDLLGLSFYPDRESGIYFVDPINRDSYIALDGYFKYLRLVKVNELQMIAQALGAKHFRVTYVSQEKAFEENKVKAKVDAVKKMGADVEHDKSTKSMNKIEVAAEMECLGHEPTEPTLQYLKGDPNIEAMVKMRLSKNAPIHQKVSVDLISLSGIKVNDAAKIDGALSSMKFSGSVSIQREAQNEARTMMEYEIDY